MARLKFGNFEIKAEMPNLGSEIPILGIEKEEPQKEQDLARLYKEIEKLRTDLFLKVNEIPEVLAKAPSLDRLEVLVNDHVFMLINHETRLDDLESKSTIRIPEVKNITQIQDVSSDVVKRCKDMVQQSEINMGMKINSLHNQNKKQKVINRILSGALILTIFLHLL